MQPRIELPIGRNRSRELRFCELLATTVAYSLSLRAIGVLELLAGIYLSYWEQFSRYCSDCFLMEELIIRECSLDWPQWYYRAHAYECLTARKLTRSSFLNTTFRVKAELLRLYECANVEVRKVAGCLASPQLYPENLVIAMVVDPNCEVGIKLVNAGLSIEGMRRELQKRREQFSSS